MADSGRFIFVAHDLIRKPASTFRDHASIRSSVSSRSASRGGLSQRSRLMRGNRIATPDLCRVERAIKLLSHSELSIADIALEIGCSCQSHFTTLFRSHTGMTPRAFRRTAEASWRRLFGTLGQPPSLRDAVLAGSEIAA